MLVVMVTVGGIPPNGWDIFTGGPPNVGGATIPEQW